MAFTVELEEWVGSAWHRFITRRASPDFPEARVELINQQRPLALLFRAMGGANGIGLEAASDRDLLLRRNVLQQIAGTCKQVPLAWCDENTLRLPSSLAVFPEVALNEELYRWLALLAAQAGRMRHWGRDNQRWTQLLLRRYPALRARYQRLVEAHLQLRPDPASLSRSEAALERVLCQALREPGSVEDFPRSERAAWPLPLWLYPPQHLASPLAADLGDESEESLTTPPGEQKGGRKRAKRIDDSPRDGGLLVVRLENLFSWTEHVDLDRWSDDSEDPDAARVADDLDELTLSRTRLRKGGGLKLHLDLPPADVDDIPLGEGIKLPEWDYRKQQMQGDFVNLQMMVPRDCDAQPLPPRLKVSAQRLRRQFEHLRNDRQWLRQQLQGSELDMQAWLDFHVEREHGQCAERGLFMEQRQTRRDLACLLLADMSMSTDAHLNDEHRVIDVIRDTLLLFGETLSGLGDDFALYGFSSLRRQQVRMQELKSFTQRYDDNTRGRIQGLKPGYYTRMGAAIRQATRLLGSSKRRSKLLLLLTDGKPNDLDLYEGRYGVEDTREAVLEARRQGLTPFCITIDREAGDYLPYMFGANGYTVIRQPEQLPLRLPQLYRQLTQP
ncbi:nitric oxide reductase activation protein NorD [Pseudomonas sp. FW306-02-F02-AA]|uniref:Nitric oxide reductase activation protein NorD n=1 Tax=Pseudomonas fluorescens TaxID=294 RepID=A0A0N9VXS2_PSEFL|nr:MULTISPECIES: VWA domain-containing protein [Pseudomonas]ALI03611.1 nitric oxide reductase activation protein NorD [Pseudomonas fluorescens]PMZ02079.1 nitric oxide reductase activation protein NorD [Pseudomonas sp. FW306-02-F02-AB]PMZ08090.1 nitric oxide reductase activation protein NorD [Pseudomonas sp. FW306-02-H06C]PMZ14690.1 nitric oxide reductase activation protein NorD [Pseudomonas sp. FW306-02-F02-AA]PMZ20725.1 nitric oxide reductase activation protein NorD [Pseudomonas sp. FW306-02-